eukprot:6867121-Pyramimonas_sp.AAC.1
MIAPISWIHFTFRPRLPTMFARVHEVCILLAPACAVPAWRPRGAPLRGGGALGGLLRWLAEPPRV